MSDDKLREVPYCDGHLDIIEIREQERQIATPERLNAYAAAGFCQTLIYDGRILGISGLVEIYPGIWEVFIVPSVYIEPVSFLYVRWFQRKLDNLIHDLHANRFQSTAIADEVSSRWMELLGFRCEGTLKRYVNGVDYRMWARLV